MAEQQKTAEEVMQELRALADRLVAAGRKDLLLKAIGVPLLEELRIEAAKSRLSRLVITKDYRFCWPTIRWRWSCSLCIRRCICCS